MADETEFSKQLAETEAALATLLPRPSRVDRDRMLFLAGRASMSSSDVERILHNGTRFWQFSMALLAIVAVGFGLALWTTKDLETVRDVAHIDPTETNKKPLAPPENEDPKAAFSREEWVNSMDAEIFLPPSSPNDNRQQNNYLRLRNIALADGIDAIPPSDSYATRVSTKPSSYGELMESLLETERRRKPTAAPSAGLFDWTSFFAPGETL